MVVSEFEDKANRRSVRRSEGYYPGKKKDETVRPVKPNSPVLKLPISQHRSFRERHLRQRYRTPGPRVRRKHSHGKHQAKNNESVGTLQIQHQHRCPEGFVPKATVSDRATS